MTDKPKTKLDEEIESCVYAATHLRESMKKGFDENPPPKGLLLLLEDITMSKATVWFCAGFAIEAAGITVQMLMRIDSYPIMDALVGGAIAIGLYLYQKKHAPAETTDA